MLSVLVQPVLKFMHFLHSIFTFILSVSFFMGQAIIHILLQACNIVRDILITLAIVGEELYSFVCELNVSIGAVINYISNSTNGGINCGLEAVVVFIKHIANFFVKTRLHSKLLATHIGRFLKEFLHLVRNALLLIADCAWWLITLLPRWLLYAIIAVGDFLVDTITIFRKASVYTAQIIVDDVFRLVIGMVILSVSWHNRRRLALTILRWILKLKHFIVSCFVCIVLFTWRICRRRVNQTLMPPLITSDIQKRSLLLSRILPTIVENPLDSMQRCVICKDRQKCVLLLPCKHLCLCEECANLLFTRHRQNCPLCRTFIDHSMSVYI